MVKLKVMRAFDVFINTDTRIPLHFARRHRISLLCIVSNASIQEAARYEIDGPVFESR
jgi:hypothetical protein